ncbi:MAG: hypothetical protein JKY53_13330 [Flavobacteriales bacterium]|nr:hypothetical protein [Flavobacteriales bacterium]
MSDFLFINKTYNAESGWVDAAESGSISVLNQQEVWSPSGTKIDDWLIGIGSFKVSYGSFFTANEENAISGQVSALSYGVKKESVVLSDPENVRKFTPYLRFRGLDVNIHRESTDATLGYWSRGLLLTVSIILIYRSV